MTSHSIGELAGTVLRKSARTAARRRARELEAARPCMGEDEPPVAPQDVAHRLSGVERHDASNTNENAGVPIGEATPASEGQRQREENRLLSYGPRTGTALPGGKLLKLVSTTGEPTHRPNLSVLPPARRVGSPVLLAVGRHDATAP